MLKFNEFIIETSDENVFKNMPEKALQDLIKYWQCKKYHFNNKDISLSKKEIKELTDFQINLKKYFPKYADLLDLKGQVLKDVIDACK